MPSYTVTAVSANIRDWTSEKAGPMKSYRAHLQNSDGILENVEIAQKAATNPPFVGQTVEGDVKQNGDWGLKLHKAFGGGGGGGGKFKPPEERRSIQMQHAQKCAVDVVRLAVDLGEWKPKDDDNAAMAVMRVAQKLYAQVEEVAKP